MDYINFTNRLIAAPEKEIGQLGMFREGVKSDDKYNLFLVKGAGITTQSKSNLIKICAENPKHAKDTIAFLSKLTKIPQERFKLKW